MLQTEAEPSVNDATTPQTATWRSLRGDYWVFFLAAFFFDAGFAVYFFLFNLFLLDAHVGERTIGLINSAFTLGSTLATLPAGLLVQRKGGRRVLLLCFILSPVLGICRLFATGFVSPLIFAFLAGTSMCLWGVGYLPAVAGLTTGANRATGYSLIFSASIITGAIGSVVSTHVPSWLASHAYALSPVVIKRNLLIASCILAAFGLLPVLKLKKIEAEYQREDWFTALRTFRPSSFLLRYLMSMALWSGVIAAVTAFGNIYLVHSRGVSFQTVGTIFAFTQVLQLLLGLCTPPVLKTLGMLRGVMVIQGAAMCCLALLTFVAGLQTVLCLFVAMSALIWMASPVLYSLLMNGVDEQQRSAAASMTLFCCSISATLATALAGVSLRSFGYPATFRALAAFGLCCAVALTQMLKPFSKQTL